jgi:hypothetical protein
LDAAGQGAKVRYALNFVVGKLNAKMIFQPRDQFERSQAIDFQFLVKIIRRRKLVAWNLKMLRRQAENFVRRLLESFHVSLFYLRQFVRAIIASRLRQVRMRALILHEFA